MSFFGSKVLEEIKNAASLKARLEQLDCNMETVNDLDNRIKHERAILNIWNKLNAPPKSQDVTCVTTCGVSAVSRAPSGHGGE